MDTQKYSKKLRQDFKEGDLVDFVYVEQGKHPQVWNRINGLGVIVSMRKSAEDSSCIYTVLSNGKSFECVEVYHLEEDTTVCDNETKHSKK